MIAFGYIGRTFVHELIFSENVNFELSKCYVSPDMSRRGLGKALCTKLERRALPSVCAPL